MRYTWYTITNVGLFGFIVNNIFNHQDTLGQKEGSVIVTSISTHLHMILLVLQLSKQSQGIKRVVPSRLNYDQHTSCLLLEDGFYQSSWYYFNSKFCYLWIIWIHLHNHAKCRQNAREPIFKSHWTVSIILGSNNDSIHKYPPTNGKLFNMNILDMNLNTRYAVTSLSIYQTTWQIGTNRSSLSRKKS